MPPDRASKPQHAVCIQIVLPRSDWHRGIIVLFASFRYLQYSFDLFWGLALSPSQTWDGILVGSCLSIYDISQSRLFMFLGILRMVFDVLFWLSADQVEDGLILDKLEKCALLDQPSLIFLILLNWTWTWKKRRNCVVRHFTLDSMVTSCVQRLF